MMGKSVELTREREKNEGGRREEGGDGQGTLVRVPGGWRARAETSQDLQ